jgi:hypothetical protein
MDALAINSGIITADLKRFAETDNRDNPSLLTRRRFELEDGKLKQTYSNITDDGSWQTYTVSGYDEKMIAEFQAPPEFIVTDGLACGSYQIEAPCIFASVENNYQGSEYKDRFELDIDDLSAFGYTYKCNKGICQQESYPPTVYGGYGINHDESDRLLLLQPSLYEINSDHLKARLMKKILSTVKFVD